MKQPHLRPLAHSRLILFLFYLGLPAFLAAQDLHYWTHPFGTRASLLGGTVVGGIGDNTAIFYNPAALTRMDSNSVSVNANLYQLENIRVTNAVGKSKNLQTLNIGSIPLLIGGRLKSSQPRLTLGYGIVKPISFNFKGTARSEGTFPISDDPISPGAEEYTGQVLFDSELNETIAVFALGYKIAGNLSIGLSNLFAVRGHSYFENTTTRMFLNDVERSLVSVNDIERTNYLQITYRPKLGVQYEQGAWSLGATITLPGIRLYSNARVGGDITGINLKLLANDRVDFTANDAQEKLKAAYKYPFAVAAGAVYRFGKNRMTATAEYFSGRDPYAIVTPRKEQFIRPEILFPDGTTDRYLQVKTAARPVLNAGIGYERELNERLVFTGSFRTDLSAYDTAMKSQNGIKPYLATWNIYHLTGGLTFKRGRHDLSVGLSLSMGSDNEYLQRVNLEDPTEGNFLQGQLQVAKAGYFATGILLGYTYLFKR